MMSLASTRWPSTLPATVALARPGPIDWATSMTETGLSNSRRLPSGSVMLIIGDSGLGIRDSEERERSARGPDRKRVVSGKRVAVRVDLGGRGSVKKKKE